MSGSWPCRLLIAACSCGVAVAQQVPDITDVYANEEEAGLARLGPAAEPGEILERYRQRLRECSRIDYRVSVGYTVAEGEEPLVVRGVVSIRREPGDGPGSFRIEATGSLPGVGAIDVTLRPDGSGLRVEDRETGAARELEDREDKAFHGLARYALISGLPTGGTPVRVDPPAAAGAGDTLHMVDETFSEHVYCVFADEDGLPRRIDRVLPGPGARPILVRTRFTELRAEPAK